MDELPTVMKNKTGGQAMVHIATGAKYGKDSDDGVVVELQELDVMHI